MEECPCVLNLLSTSLLLIGKHEGRQAMKKIPKVRYSWGLGVTSNEHRNVV